MKSGEKICCISSEYGMEKKTDSHQISKKLWSDFYSLTIALTLASASLVTVSGAFSAN